MVGLETLQSHDLSVNPYQLGEWATLLTLCLGGISLKSHPWDYASIKHSAWDRVGLGGCSR